MSEIKDGGSAFPSVREYQYGPCGSLQSQEHIPGMSLRDWFAGQALCGMLPELKYGVSDTETAGEKLSRSAYEMADCMLKAREAK